MRHDPEFWERLLPTIRSGDRDEAIRALRHLLNADPFRITPRHWLAEIHRRAGHDTLALGQYDRLFPLAVGAGDLFRTIAVQKRLEELDPRPGVADRFAAIHRWFRLLGPGHMIDAPGTQGTGLSARVLVTMPAEAFVHAATHATIESFEREPCVIELSGEEQMVVLFGAFAWDIKLPDGRRRREEHVVEGMRFQLDPDQVPSARMRVRPDTPCECLRFGARLLVELGSAQSWLAAGGGYGADDIVREERVMLPARPRRPEDIDRRVSIPAPRAAEGPPRLDFGGPTNPVPSEALDDVESWVGHRSLTLDATPLDLSGEVAIPEPADVPILDLDANARPGRATRRGRPVVEAAGPLELGDGLVVPPSRDPFAEPVGDVGAPIERREADRVARTLGGRVRLMGLADDSTARLDCTVFDVSPGGVGVSFQRERVLGAIAVLEHEVLRVELDLPDGDVFNVAARMRWVDLDDPNEVRAGLQFVLLAPGDRATLAELVGAPAGPPAS